MNTWRRILVALALLLPCTHVAAQTSCLNACKFHPTAAPVPCDVTCSGGATCSGPSGCDVCLPLDGKCTICGTDNSEQLNGTAGADIICPAGGNDTIDAKGGADAVYLGGITVNIATGIPVVGADGPAGNTIVMLGAGNDQASPAFCEDRGDDIIFGEGGDDYIDAGNGRNFSDGGPGNDTLENNAAGCANPEVDDVVGSLLCGGTGNDVLFGSGPAHQCMDAGPDQAPPQGTNDCSYIFAAGGRAQTAFDLGTGRRCVRANVVVGGESCGCD